MDVIDQAQAFDALNLEQALEVQRARAKVAPQLQPLGRCRNPDCDLDFEPGSPKLYCDARCADAHSRIPTRR